MAYTRKTPDELERLAWDVVAGAVYGTWMIEPRDIPLVFMGLNFMDKAELEQWLRGDDIAHLYEYISKAAPRAINGMPCFFSCHYLDRQDADALRQKIEEIQEFRKSRQIT
jgi:hypothetical protein